MYRKKLSDTEILDLPEKFYPAITQDEAKFILLISIYKNFGISPLIFLRIKKKYIK
jgi:hypothetical protein